MCTLFTIHFISPHDPRRRLIMKLKRLALHESLVTEISGEVADLASILGIPYEIDNDHDHIYIKFDCLPLELSSFYLRRKSDVEISTKVFCEILMDIKGGLTVLEAYEKQGYTF